VDNKKLWRWYRDSLSGFLSDEAVRHRHEHDIVIKDKGVEKTIRVPIFSLENMGEAMAIDEKQIGDAMYTVLSNRRTKKIAMLAKTVKAKELIELWPKFQGSGFGVKSITRDLSPSYDWFCRQVFCNALHVADKFHIIKSLLDSCQAVRIRYRQELLTAKRLKYEAFKTHEHRRKQGCRKANQPFEAQKFVYNAPKAANGESLLELLARSRYLLYKYPDAWTDSQKERAEALFSLYPDLKKSHSLVCSFRSWYTKKNVGKSRAHLKSGLQRWYLEVEKGAVMELENFKSTVERHEGLILNYFVNGDTNAGAEGLNSRIQRFIMINQGTRDREFFFFRLANLFVAPQNGI
jgi:transposase